MVGFQHIKHGISDISLVAWHYYIVFYIQSDLACYISQIECKKNEKEIENYIVSDGFSHISKSKTALPEYLYSLLRYIGMTTYILLESPNFIKTKHPNQASYHT